MTHLTFPLLLFTFSEHFYQHQRKVLHRRLLLGARQVLHILFCPQAWSHSSQMRLFGDWIDSIRELHWSTTLLNSQHWWLALGCMDSTGLRCSCIRKTLFPYCPWHCLCHYSHLCLGSPRTTCWLFELLWVVDFHFQVLDQCLSCQRSVQVGWSHSSEDFGKALHHQWQCLLWMDCSISSSLM